VAIKGAPPSSGTYRHNILHCYCCTSAFPLRVCAHRIYEISHLKPHLAAAPARLLPEVLVPIQLLPGGTRSCTATSRWCVLLNDYFPLLLERHSWNCTTFYLPASTEIGYFNQLNMSTIRNGTAGASDTDPASRYNLKLSHLFIVFFLFIYRLSVNTNNPYDAIGTTWSSLIYLLCSFCSYTN
jgi:hypothetical protein